MEVVERAGLPHDLPSAGEALQTIQLGATAGPKKPVLERVFKPMGYSRRGGSGMFSLRRRTPKLACGALPGLRDMEPQRCRDVAGVVPGI